MNIAQLHKDSNTDLCAGTVKIRLSFMQRIANIAVGRSLIDLQASVNDANELAFQNKPMPSVYAENLVRSAKAYADSSEFKRAVDGLNERETFILVREEGK